MYGGTKEEMERLLEDAQKLTGIEYNIDNLADVYSAIHAIQDEMGITGTTAREASTTIQGSLSMLKASWQNLLVGFADESQDVGKLIENLFESAMTVGDNILPRIQTTLNGISQGIEKAAPKIIETIPGLLNSTLPGLLEAASTVLESVISVIVGSIPGLLEIVTEAVLENLPILIDGAIQLMVGLIEVLPDIINLLNGYIPQIIASITTAFQEALPQLQEAFRTLIESIFGGDAASAFDVFVQTIQSIIPFLMDAINTILPIVQNLDNTILPFVMLLVTTLLPFLQDLIQTLLPAAQELLTAIIPIIGNIFQALSPILDSLLNLIETILPILMPFIETLCDTLIGILEPAMEAISPTLESILEAISPILDVLTSLVEMILPILIDQFTDMAELLTTVVGGAFRAVKPYIDAVMQVLKDLMKFIKDVFKGDWQAAWTDIINIFKDIINILPAALETTINMAISLINDLIQGINNITDAVGISAIPFIKEVKLPRLAQGGVLEKGQIGLLEGDGAEAVVPLEKNREWIARVSDEMQNQGIGGGSESLGLLQEIANSMQNLVSAVKENNEMLPNSLVDAMAEGLEFNIDNREFARLVRQV